MALNEDDKQWIEAVLEALENRLMNRMRDMQTELLRGFEAYSRPVGAWTVISAHSPKDF
jgi:hypothetical protein